MTGGVGYARLQHAFTTTNGVNQFTPQRDKSWAISAQLGGGAEVMVSPHVGLGIEYLYNHFRDRKYSVAVTQGTAPLTNRIQRAPTMGCMHKPTASLKLSVTDLLTNAIGVC